MYLSNHLRSVAAGLLLGSLIFFSCSEKNPTTALNSSSETGIAQVILPDLSSGSLTKAAAGMETNALTLLIVAADMDTIKRSWPVSSLKGQTVQIDGIPSGQNRLFEGFLTNKSGVLTHSGKVSVQIMAGQSVPVHLKLSGVGSADVCIEVEGYPSACNQNDTINDSLAVYSCLNGYTPSTKLSGNIKMYIYGKKVSGSFSLYNEPTKSSFGNFYFEELIRLQDSSCQTMVVEVGSKTRHFLNMIVNKNSEITYAYLSIDTSLQSDAIAKFYSVPCDTFVPDTTIIDTLYPTTTVDFPFNCKAAYPDTTTFYATVILKVTNAKAVGNIYLTDSAPIKEKTLSVQGIYQRFADSTSGYIDLTTTDTSGCYKQILVKFYQGNYTGVIYQKGTCGQKDIADITRIIKPVKTVD